MSEMFAGKPKDNLSTSAPGGNGIEDCSEKIISRVPIVIRRRAQFGDCDPAGVVYTPMFSHYAVGAYQWTMSVLLGGPMLAMQKKYDFDSPIRALSFEFLNVIEVEQVFDMTSLVVDIRNRTFDLLITGRSVEENTRELFTARLTPITVSRSGRCSMAIPPILRRELEDYQERTRLALG